MLAVLAEASLVPLAWRRQLVEELAVGLLALAVVQKLAADGHFVLNVLVEKLAPVFFHAASLQPEPAHFVLLARYSCACSLISRSISSSIVFLSAEWRVHSRSLFSEKKNQSKNLNLIH